MRSMILIGIILLALDVLFVGASGAYSTTPSCGTTTITFYIYDSDTGAAIVGVTLVAPEGTFSATVQNTPTGFKYPQASVATIPNMNYGDSVQISAPNYFTFTQVEDYCPTLGTNENVIASIFLNPLSIVNTATTTQTVINYINSTTYSTVTSTVSGTPVTSTVTSVSSITQTLTLPPLVTTQTVTSTITNPTTITYTQSGTVTTQTITGGTTTIIETSTGLAYYTVTTTVSQGTTYTTTKLITQTQTVGVPAHHISTSNLEIASGLGLGGIASIVLGLLIRGGRKR